MGVLVVVGEGRLRPGGSKGESSGGVGRRHPRSRPPNRPFTEVHNWSHRNILRNHIPPPHDVDTDILEACFQHCRRQQRIVPSPIQPKPWLPPGETLCEPVLKAAQGLLHPGGQDPHLFPKKQYRLYYCLGKIPQYLRVRPLATRGVT